MIFFLNKKNKDSEYKITCFFSLKKLKIIFLLTWIESTCTYFN